MHRHLVATSLLYGSDRTIGIGSKIESYLNSSKSLQIQGIMQITNVEIKWITPGQ